MNRLQNTVLVLVIVCLGTVFAGLLPGGGGGNGGAGYQYNRPGTGGGIGGNNGFGSNGRPSGLYGAPGFGNQGGFGGQGNNGGFGQRPSPNYGAPAGFGNQGYQGAQGNGGYNYNDDNARPKPYSFQYEVRDPPSGNDYNQQESSDGNTVQGEYRVLLPDSRTQIVRYTADDVNGYNAEVQYEGQAQFPQNGGYNQGGNNFNGGHGGFGGYHGGAEGGSGFNNGAANNQYLPPGADYGK